MKGRVVQTQSKRGLWNYTVNPEGVHFVKETDESENVEQAELHGPSWLFGLIQLKRGEIAYVCDGHFVQPVGDSWGVFYPPFAYSRVRVKKAALSAEGFWSTAKLPSHVTKRPIWFPQISGLGFPTGVKEVIKYLEAVESPEDVSYRTSPSVIAKKAKRLIETRMTSSTVSIAQIAQEIGTSAPQLSRCFKDNYALSPLQYLHRLRAAHGVFSLLSGHKGIAEVGFDLGFNDLGRFHKAVKKITTLTPGKFSRKHR